jgi:hypothetical protein
MPRSESLLRAPQPPPPPITSESIAAEHLALQATVGALETALQPAPDDPAWRTRLLSRLGQLQQQLEGHFAAEEQSGLYEDLAEACPQHAGAALRLRREHDDLRRRVELLFGEAGATPVGELRDLAGRVRGVLRDLRHHESRENEQLSDTLDDGGLGVGD